MNLIIAEKKSVGQAIAAVLCVNSRKEGYIEGGGYVISWYAGHLLGLAQADAYGEQVRQMALRRPAHHTESLET